MSSLCGAKCDECQLKDKCKGCIETNGCPFGGKCVAAEYIKLGGIDAYNDFKNKLTAELNEYLTYLGLPVTEKLFELSGEYVNLKYPLPSGQAVNFLDDKKIYLGCQIEAPDMGVCFGAVADTDFILVCSYSTDGTEPELLGYKHR